MTLALDWIMADGTAARVILDRQLTLIGRADDADVRLQSPAVSRRHAQVVCQGSHQWFIKDMGSRSGIHVNGQRVQQASIKPGDVIQITTFFLHVRDLDEASSSLADAIHRGMPDDEQTNITVIEQIAPPRIETRHLSLLQAFTNLLDQTEVRSARNQLLCDTIESLAKMEVTAQILQVSINSNDITWSRVAGSDRPMSVSRSLLRAMTERCVAVMGTNVQPDGDMVAISLSAESMRISAIACPLNLAGEGLLVYVTLPEVRATAEWALLVTMAAHQFLASEARWEARTKAQVYAAVERELQQARELQLSLVPNPPTIPGYVVDISYQPCDLVGGDYTDAIDLQDGRWLFVVADVSGHGLTAALTALRLHSMFQTTASTGTPLSKLIEHINRHLLRFLANKTFVTLVAVVLDPVTGAIEWLNAGHPPLLRISASGHIARVEEPGNLPLGIEDVPLLTGTATLSPGQSLLLYSDGIFEAPGPDGRLLGITGLERLVCHFWGDSLSSPNSTKTFRQVFEHICLATQGTPFVDDRTYLVARRCEQ